MVLEMAAFIFMKAVLCLPQDQGYVLFSKFGKGLKNLCMVENMFFDGVYHAKEAPDFFDVVMRLRVDPCPVV